MVFDEININLAFIRKKYFNRILRLYKPLLYVVYSVINSIIKVLIKFIRRRKGKKELLNKKYKKKKAYR